MVKNYTVEVTPEEIHCIQVVAILLIKLLIEYFGNKNKLIEMHALVDTLKILEKK